MQIKYKIIEVNDKEHSYTVRYYTDTLNEDALASHFAPDGSIIRDDKGSPVRCRTDYHINMFKTDMSEDEIALQIKKAAPKEWFQMLEDIKLKETTSLKYVVDRVGLEHAFDSAELEAPLTAAPTMSSEEIDELLKKMK